MLKRRVHLEWHAVQRGVNVWDEREFLRVLGVRNHQGKETRIKRNKEHMLNCKDIILVN